MKILNILIILFTWLGGNVASAKNIPNLALEVKNRLVNDPQQAFSWIQSLGTSSEVCDIYNQAVQDLYWLEKGSKSLIIVGKAGISYCLTESEKLASKDQQGSDNFKAQAKTISYNLASNSWPGWGDEGVSIARPEIEAGLESAKLNLKLAYELNKPADKIASAYWLLSALQLALQKYQDSLLSIDQSNNYAQQSKDETIIAYGTAFKGLILLASGNKNEGQQLFDSNILKLKNIGSDDALSYVGQLDIAKKIFDP